MLVETLHGEMYQIPIPLIFTIPALLVMVVITTHTGVMDTDTDTVMVDILIIHTMDMVDMVTHIGELL